MEFVFYWYSSIFIFFGVVVDCLRKFRLLFSINGDSGRDRFFDYCFIFYSFWCYFYFFVIFWFFFVFLLKENISDVFRCCFFVFEVVGVFILRFILLGEYLCFFYCFKSFKRSDFIDREEVVFFISCLFLFVELVWKFFFLEAGIFWLGVLLCI